LHPDPAKRERDPYGYEIQQGCSESVILFVKMRMVTNPKI